MKRNNKKGFTIVELVIVIAVIAILAAVLIPTFSSVIKKAKVNNDIQLVRNLNTALATDNKKHATMQSALDSAAEFGYDVAKINASATDNEI
ncbi:MAG: type II secretion system GspH family protein, partial [Clostridiales bacterium]|nr:type II secretion system GspH family protein [Clostridiales bacterium]